MWYWRRALFFWVNHQISTSYGPKNRWFQSNLSKIITPVAAIKSPNLLKISTFSYRIFLKAPFRIAGSLKQFSLMGFNCHLHQSWMGNWKLCIPYYSAHRIPWKQYCDIQLREIECTGYLFTWYTWLNYPSSPMGRDLSLRLNHDRERADITFSSRRFLLFTSRFITVTS